VIQGIRVLLCRSTLGLVCALAAAPVGAGAGAGIEAAVAASTEAGMSAVAPPSEPGGARTALEEAMWLLGREEYAAAVEAFKHANRAAGGHCGECLLGLAKAFERLDRVEPAIATVRDAIAALGDSPFAGTAHVDLGQLLLGRQGPGDLEEADRAFSRASQLLAGRPNRAAALSGMAMVRLRQKRYVDAVDTARDALGASSSGPAERQARIALCLARVAGPVRGPVTTGSPAAGAEVEKPERIYTPSPFYPEFARLAAIEGKVTVESSIDSEGCVTEVRVLKGLHRDLDRSALEAVRNWVFEPAKAAGKPVKVSYVLSVNFEIGPRSTP
jgi:TonB family protein